MIVGRQLVRVPVRLPACAPLQAPPRPRRCCHASHAPLRKPTCTLMRRPLQRGSGEYATRQDLRSVHAFSALAVPLQDGQQGWGEVGPRGGVRVRAATVRHLQSRACPALQIHAPMHVQPKQAVRATWRATTARRSAAQYSTYLNAMTTVLSLQPSRPCVSVVPSSTFSLHGRGRGRGQGLPGPACLALGQHVRQVTACVGTSASRGAATSLQL